MKKPSGARLGTAQRWAAAVLFRPRLAGATLKDRLIASLGAIVGVAATGFVTALTLGRGPHLPLIVAPMGASAVLLFAVPSSPLAQPWSIVGGNTISALVGVGVRMLIPDPVLATGVAVGLAIAVMSVTRCLHPPGGAAALTAVVGGPAVTAAGFGFAFAPVGINALLLAGLGLAFHRLVSRHAYPHVAPAGPVRVHDTADPSPAERVGFSDWDIDAALAELGESFDIDRNDLGRLLRRVELKALAREHQHLTCADIMSRDVVTVLAGETLVAARALLVERDLRELPVVDTARRLVGVVGQRDLAREASCAARVLRPAPVAAPDTPVFDLLADLLDRGAHMVVVIDDNARVVGLVSHLDMLAAVARLPGRAERADALVG